MTKAYNSKNIHEAAGGCVKADANLDCQHRGESLGSINCGCGSVNRDTEVFQCAIFQACTLTALGGRAGWLKLGIKKRPAYCRTCEERTP